MAAHRRDDVFAGTCTSAVSGSARRTAVDSQVLGVCVSSLQTRQLLVPAKGAEPRNPVAALWALPVADCQSIGAACCSRGGVLSQSRLYRLLGGWCFYSPLLYRKKENPHHPIVVWGLVRRGEDGCPVCSVCQSSS